MLPEIQSQIVSEPLHLIAAQPELFATQGAVVPTWRRSDGRQRGPYYELVWREQRRRRHIYLGREGPKVDKVRRALQSLQRPLRQARALKWVRRQARASFQQHKVELRRRLAEVGLRLQGSEIRGWRTNAPPSDLAEFLRTQTSADASPAGDPLESDRVVRGR